MSGIEGPDAQRHGVQSYFGAPLFLEEKLAGIIAVMDTSPWKSSPG